MIKTKQFKSQPQSQIDKMNNWLKDNQNKIEILGQTNSPYRMKIRNGFKETETEVITIYYKEIE